MQLSSRLEERVRGHSGASGARWALAATPVLPRCNVIAQQSPTIRSFPCVPPPARRAACCSAIAPPAMDAGGELTANRAGATAAAAATTATPPPSLAPATLARLDPVPLAQVRSSSAAHAAIHADALQPRHPTSPSAPATSPPNPCNPCLPSPPGAHGPHLLL